MPHAHTVVGIGEILWDLLPSGKQVGGAPANFAYCSHLLGENAIVLSRVGNDLLGKEIREELTKAAIGDQFLQADPVHPTGVVQVRLDGAGQPTFEIVQPVAWDFIEWTPELRRLASEVDAVCFGSLAQRSAGSRAAIRNFVATTRSDALRVLDVNLRQSFYSAEIIVESLKLANVVKLNHEEVPRMRELLAITNNTDILFCQTLIEQFDLRLVCITRGEHGALLCSQDGVDEHSGFRVRVKDTIGAGDAFTAALVHGLLEKRPLPKINELANRLGAWVASNLGATPQFPAAGLSRALMEIT
ncbi:MAG TPA: carbohydrate kinase [Terriglobales bacterium]|nr:carbohydrate kinase [Terriglobales bacterium]